MNELNDNLLPHLGFRKYAPCKQLLDYVDCYWFINAESNSGEGYKEYLHPDGGVSVIFNYGQDLYFGNNLTPDGPFIDGANTQSVCLKLTGKISAVGIRFKPAGAYAFFSIPLHELKNQVFSCADINKQMFSRLYDLIPVLANDLACIRKIDKTLYSLLSVDRQVSAIIKGSISIMKRHKGALPIRKLASSIGIDQRQLERICRSQIGITPVELSRTERISQARLLIKNTDGSLSNIAYDLGFYDQSHFVNQFKWVVGITPGEYRRIVMGKKALRLSTSVATT